MACARLGGRGARYEWEVPAESPGSEERVGDR
jgi:hypothetical protein